MTFLPSAGAQPQFENQVNSRADFEQISQRTQAAHPVTTASYSTPASAQPNSRPIAPPSETSGDGKGSGSSPLGMLISLAFVIGLIFAGTWVARKTGWIRPLQTELDDEVVQLIGRRSLGARQQLMVIKFGSKILLVNNSQGETRTLSEITDPAEVHTLLQQTRGQSGEREQPVSLRGLLGGRIS